MVSLQAHNGIRNQHSRDIKLCDVLGKQLMVVISDSQSTKHRVTLFHYVVFAQDVCCTSTGTMSGQYGCKITKYLGNGKESSGKIWNFPKKLLSLQRQTLSLATPLSAGSKALQILLHLNKGCINKRCSFSISRIFYENVCKTSGFGHCICSPKSF